MHFRIVVLSVLVAGCLPRPQVASTTPQPPPVAQAQLQPPQQQPPQQQPPPQVQPQDPYQQQQQQPPQQPPQPYPPQPYPPQPYTQPYPPSPYGYNPAYQPPPLVVVGPPGRDHIHDGEVIGDFAAVGAFATIDLLTKHQFENQTANSFLVLGGLGGGAAVGYMLTQSYDIDAGVSHATTTGLLLGVANGALLIQPTGADNADSVLGLMVLGSAAGAAGGFAYGQNAHLTAGQATFVGNMILLGAATAALGGILGSTDGKYGTPENTALILGTDGGAVVGALVAPSLDWSPHRAKFVFAGTMVGAFVGGMVSGLLTKSNNMNGTSSSTDANGDAVTAAMTAGLWGGFGLAILMTKDDVPDAKYVQPARRTSTAPSTQVMPWVGPQGTLGMITGGTF